MEQQQAPIPNVLSQETSYLHLNFLKYVLYIIKVAFSTSDEQPSFLTKLSEARYRAPLLAAVRAVHMGYFQPLLPVTHITLPQPLPYVTLYDLNNLPTLYEMKEMLELHRTYKRHDLSIKT